MAADLYPVRGGGIEGKRNEEIKPKKAGVPWLVTRSFEFGVAQDPCIFVLLQALVSLRAQRLVDDLSTDIKPI